MEILGVLVLVGYAALGCWAAKRTVFANKILIGTGVAIFTKVFFVGTVFGVVLIPVALIKTFLLKR